MEQLLLGFPGLEEHSVCCVVHPSVAGLHSRPDYPVSTCIDTPEFRASCDPYRRALPGLETGGRHQADLEAIGLSDKECRAPRLSGQMIICWGGGAFGVENVGPYRQGRGHRWKTPSICRVGPP